MRRPPPHSCSRIRDATSRCVSRSRRLPVPRSVYYAPLDLAGGDLQTRDVRVPGGLRHVLCLLGALPGVARAQQPPSPWAFGPFHKPREVNPIILPDPGATFRSPMIDTLVRWEEYATFNPAAVVKDGTVYVLYRAEDASGDLGRSRAVDAGGGRSGKAAARVDVPAGLLRLLAGRGRTAGHHHRARDRPALQRGEQRHLRGSAASGASLHRWAGAVRRPQPPQADRPPGRALHQAGRRLRADGTVSRGHDVRGGAGPLQGALVLVLRHGRLARGRGGVGRAALTVAPLRPQSVVAQLKRPA